MTNYNSSKIKSFVLGHGRITKGQSRAINELSPKWCIEPQKNPLNFKKIFKSKKPIVIDVGFGMGEELIDYAQKNTDKNILGIDIYKPGIGRALRQIEINNIKNIRIINADAVEILELMIDNNSISEFHIYFPDPWPKKKHNKRRLIKKNFAELVKKKLTKKGIIHCITDDRDYALQILDTLESTKQLLNTSSNFSSRSKNRKLTKFEKKAEEQMLKIYEIKFKKN